MTTVGSAARDPRVAVAFRRVRRVLAVHAGDVFIGVLVATVVLERLVLDHGGTSVALAASWGLPLLARRRLPVLAPLATLALIGVILVAIPEVSHGTGGELLLSLTAVWLLTAHNPPERAVWSLPAVMIVMLSLDTSQEVLMVAVLLAGSAAAGAVHRRDRREMAVHHAHVAALERSRDAALDAAAADERARIARELHDIVAHSVSVMTVQAGAARMQLLHDPDQALASVTAVEEATTAALGDLDRLVGLLGEGAQPIHGLDDVERLVAQMVEAGLDVRLAIHGDHRPLPAGLDLTLYRILQEALTNARKHAGPVGTDVDLIYDREEVRVRVVNDLPLGAAAEDPMARRHGHGLIGMRERVAMYGGQLRVDADHGRFRLHAQMPTP